MGSIAKTLLTYNADVTVRGHPPVGPVDEEGNPMDPTLTELASDDRVLHGLLMDYQMLHTAPRVKEEVD